MGAWGTAIFSDDLACDVRRTYKDLLTYGRTPEEAEEVTLKEYLCGDEETDPVVWLALAATEWKCGRMLSDRVKKEAMDFIAAGGDCELFETAAEQKKRRQALEKLRDQLLEPLPKPPKLRKLTTIRSPWKIGDVLAIPLASEGGDTIQYGLIQVVRIKSFKYSPYAPDDDVSDSPQFCVWNLVSSGIPEQSILDKPHAFVFERREMKYVMALSEYTNREVPRAAPLCEGEELYSTLFSFDLFSRDKKLYKEYIVLGNCHVPDVKFFTEDELNYFGGYNNHLTLPMGVRMWLRDGTPFIFDTDRFIKAEDREEYRIQGDW